MSDEDVAKMQNMITPEMMGMVKNMDPATIQNMRQNVVVNMMYTMYNSHRGNRRCNRKRKCNRSSR